MDSPTRAAVRRALDQLKPYLASYVTQSLDAARIVRRPERSDIQALIGAMIEHWDAVFARHLSPTVRHYLFELRDIRNRWAHEEPFDEDEARRAVDTARLVAKAIGAPSQAIHGMDTPSTTPPPAPRVAPASAEPRRCAAVTVRRDAHGVILNAVELSADDVAMQRVRCPACDEKVFETWPGGWDAHAAHVCPGIPRGSENKRKAEYRRQFSHLFRGAGVAAAPSKQRDIMRRLYVRFAPDLKRVIREYADAERRGEVARARNTYSLSPEEYARRLLADGEKKGWLPQA